MAIFRRPEQLWPALWAGVVVALGAVVVLEHFFGRVTVGEGPRSPAKVVEAKLLPPFTLPPETQAAPETVARPLFVPTRRPSPPAAASSVATMKRGQFVLTGITVTPDGSFVFLKEVATGKTKSVRKGAQVNGIAVDTVEPRRVVLKQGEELEELSLNIQAPVAVAPAPAPAPTAAVPPASGAAPAQAVPPVAAPPGAAPPGQPPLPGAPAAPAPPLTRANRPWLYTQ